MNATANGNGKTHPTCWFLAVITNGLDMDGYRVGHHVYVSVTPDGRVFVLAKGGRKVTLKSVDEAARHLRRIRGADGRFVRVANQSMQWERWFEGRQAAA